MSDRIDDGGAAFPDMDRFDPVPSLGEGWQMVSRQRGMSLRDYFAARAMQAIITRPMTEPKENGIAMLAYSFADSMLKARKS